MLEKYWEFLFFIYFYNPFVVRKHRSIKTLSFYRFCKVDKQEKYFFYISLHPGIPIRPLFSISPIFS